MRLFKIAQTKMIEQDCWVSPQGKIFPVLFGTKYHWHAATAAKLLKIKIFTANGQAVKNFTSLLVDAYFTLLRKGYARVVYDTDQLDIQLLNLKFAHETMPVVLELLSPAIQYNINIEITEPRKFMKMSREEAEEEYF